jgi:hypothetical protein
MGEFADYTLDEVMDYEDEIEEYRTGKVPKDEAIEKGILDEEGNEEEIENA